MYLLHLLLSTAPTFFFPLIFIYGKNFIEERVLDDRTVILNPIEEV